jgi:hypothetical protein
VFFLLAFGLSGVASGQAWYQGGSNYNWYAPDGWYGKSFWDFSIIRNYDKLSIWPFGPGNPVSVAWER